MWEYKRELYSLASVYEIDKVLNKEGSDNWEIVKYDETKPEKFGDDVKLTVLF